MRDRVEHMSGEMKLTPATHPPPPLRLGRCSFQHEGGESPVGWWPSHYHLSLFPATSARYVVRWRSPSGEQCRRFLSLCAHTLPPPTDVLSEVGFFKLSSGPASSLFAPSPSFQQWLKSWMYWHVSFHHANAGEERGERSGRGESVLRRKGPSQPRAKPCPSSGEPRRCDSVLLKPGQLLVTLAHRCTHSKEVTHTHPPLSLKSPRSGCTGGGGAATLRPRSLSPGKNVQERSGLSLLTNFPQSRFNSLQAKHIN